MSTALLLNAFAWNGKYKLRIMANIMHWPYHESVRRYFHFSRRSLTRNALRVTTMKATLTLVCLSVLFLVNCRGAGGPATRAGRGVDHAVSKVGTGVKKVGQKIENAAR